MPELDRVSRPLAGAVLIATCALVLSVPRLADACGAAEPELHEIVPTEGASYPANAPLLFWGVDLSLAAVTVTVDGEPATLVQVDARGMADLVARVEPEPQEGQTVVVSGSFCGTDLCGPITLTFTAGAPDLTAPAPIVEESFFAVYDHAPFELTSGCDITTQIHETMYVHLKQPAPAAGEALPFFRVAWDPDGDGPAGIDRLVRAPADALVLAFAIAGHTLGGRDWIADVCLEVTAFDAAGNEAAPFELCPPCFLREDDVKPPEALPAEPAWTEADAVPGSACAPATATTGAEAPTTGSEPTGGETGDSTDTSGGPDSATGGEDSPDKGCACRSEGGGGGPGSLVLLALGLGLTRRRR